MGIMIFILKSQRRAFRWPNNFRARLYTIYIYIYIYISIGWQAYRGDQIHRKNSPTLLQSQIQVKKKKDTCRAYKYNIHTKPS